MAKQLLPYDSLIQQLDHISVDLHLSGGENLLLFPSVEKC
jgi:hypothetical protein